MEVHVVCLCVCHMYASPRCPPRRFEAPLMSSSVWPDDGVGVVATPWMAVADMASE